MVQQEDPEQQQMVIADEEEPTLPPWTLEPKTLDQLLEHYIVENKLPGRSPSTTIFIVQAKARGGTTTECLENQTKKMFLDTWSQKSTWHLEVRRMKNKGAKHRLIQIWLWILIKKWMSLNCLYLKYLSTIQNFYCPEPFHWTQCRQPIPKKPFEAAHQDVEISSSEYQICHGKSTFLKPEKVAKMQREHTGTGQCVFILMQTGQGQNDNSYEAIISILYIFTDTEGFVERFFKTTTNNSEP